MNSAKCAESEASSVSNERDDRTIIMSSDDEIDDTTGGQDDNEEQETDDDVLSSTAQSSPITVNSADDDIVFEGEFNNSTTSNDGQTDANNEGDSGPTLKRNRDNGSGEPDKSASNKRRKKTANVKRPDEGSSGDEFEPDNDEEASSSSSDDADSVLSKDLSESEISESDFEDEADKSDGEETINLSSGGESPKKPVERPTEKAQTFDLSSQVFWSKVEELKAKGFSIQQTNGSRPSNRQDGNQREPAPEVAVRPVSGPINNPKLTSFTQIYTNFQHKRCLRKCFMMDPKQQQALSEINDASWLTADFIKACIRVIMCCIKLGDFEAGRSAVEAVTRLGEIPAISALTQAMISGAKNHYQTISQLKETEMEAIKQMNEGKWAEALGLTDKALEQASNCIRLKMMRGNCLGRMDRWVEGARTASSIISQDPKNVGALFLRGFCLYNKDSIDRAITHFTQVLQLSKDHLKAKNLLQKAKLIKEKKDLGSRATQFNKLQDALQIYTLGLELDPKNRCSTARLYAARADVYYKMESYTKSIEDCDQALVLDPSCLAAMVQRAKCYMELQDWEKAVRDLERANAKDKHSQQNKKKAGDMAFQANNFEEAFRSYQDAFNVDRHNQTYRGLLKQAKRELVKRDRKDFYGILGIEKTVGESEIRKAYFKKSKEYHPDRHANADEETKEDLENKFKLVKEAYETLKDIEKRKIYDQDELKPPPGGWYVDLDPKILTAVQAKLGRGAVTPILVRGRVQQRGNVVFPRGTPRPMMRGMGYRGVPGGNVGGIRGVPATPGANGFVRGRARAQPVRMSSVRGVLRPQMTPIRGTVAPRARMVGANRANPTIVRPIVRGAAANVVRPAGQQRLVRPGGQKVLVNNTVGVRGIVPLTVRGGANIIRGARGMRSPQPVLLPRGGNVSVRLVNGSNGPAAPRQPLIRQFFNRGGVTLTRGMVRGVAPRARGAATAGFAAQNAPENVTGSMEAEEIVIESHDEDGDEEDLEEVVEDDTDEPTEAAEKLPSFANTWR